VKREINKISIHCSATKTGGVRAFDVYHREVKHWHQVGYHFVIGNGMIDGHYIKSADGNIEVGRPLSIDPAAVKGHNKGMIAICLVGDSIDSFTEKQFDSLKKLIVDLCSEFNIDPFNNVLGHRDFPGVKKECPCFDVKTFVKKYKNGEGIKVLKEIENKK